MSIRFVFIWVIALSLGCAQTSNPQITPTVEVPQDTIKEVSKMPSFNLPYELDEPDKTFKLEGALDEISGLGITPADSKLIAVQDEKGKIYVLDKKNGEIERKISFWKDGDYEGVEPVGNDIFVVKSSGTLYEVTHPGSKTQEVIKHKFFFNKKYDVEGLCYDEKNNRLLLACKGKPGDGKEFEAQKAVYALDLATFKMGATPAFTISQDEINTYLERDPKLKNLEILLEFFHPSQSEFGFSPSAIAVHPITDNVYITSSVGKLLVILNPAGEIIHIEKLKSKIHPQPEGLCFEKDGTLYISSESKSKDARIHRFKYQPFQPSN